jgi:LytS/YehU family sensor histidine kinase
MARDTYFIILIVSASTLYYFIKDAIITKRRLMKMEIQFLQNQIKPHFFNNELNNLLGLVRKGDKDQSEIYIKFLSEYMSFNLKSDINMMNSLKEEVNCILAYLDNIEQRISPLVKIEYTVHKPLTSLKIYPLILMTLVENAVKHSGILESEEGAIVLDIKTEHNLLIFTLENSIHLDVDGGINSTKIGLINMKKRLNLQYQDRYDLSILEKEDSYFVELTIVLDEA